jgi:hypothetical protein
MRNSLIFIITLLSASVYGDKAPVEKIENYDECVSVYGPSIIDVEDLKSDEVIDKDDVFKFPEGWKFVTFSHASGSATVIFLCR